MSDLAIPDGGGDYGVMSGVLVPAQPVIRPSEQYIGGVFPLHDGLSPTIGWQWPEKDGAPVFAIITRTFAGSHKIQEHFPLTEEGWASAWHALVRRSPGNAAKIEAILKARLVQDQRREQGSSETAVITELDAQSLATVLDVQLLGGYAATADMTVGERYDLRFLADRLVVFPFRLPHCLLQLPYGDLETVDIGGPGLVKSGGGFVGGGFGAVGALQGMAVAAVLNALTTRTKITTVLRIQSSASELFLLNTTMTPGQLRMHLSRPLGAIRAARAAPAGNQAASVLSPVDELTRLAAMLENGLLTREEFDLLKGRLLAGA
jgi:hypothetical protein